MSSYAQSILFQSFKAVFKHCINPSPESLESQTDTI